MSDTNEVCSICGHAIVEGVACDYQPPSCPFRQEMEANVSNGKSFTFPPGEDQAVAYSPTSD